MSEFEHDDAFETHRQPDPHAPDAERPDWLVGAEEGAQAEQGRDGQPSPHLKLVRPEGPAPTADAPKKPARPEAWKAAASSVPKLRRVEGGAPAPTRPAPARPAAPAPREAEPEPAWAEPAFAASSPASDLDDLGPEGPLAAEAEDPLAVTRAPVAPPRPVKLDEPWWAIAADAVQTNRALQLGVLAVLLSVVAWLVWPRSQPTVSIATIHDHPERFDGVTVRVNGKVGDVYEIGGAYAFYLQQGRDTIVVFSRVRRPYRNEKVHVAGSVSMGYLDGVARPSLFEVPE